MKPAQKKLGTLVILYVIGILCVMTIATALLS